MDIETLANRNVVAVSPDDKLSKAMSLMESGRMHQLPVMEGKNYTGMIFLRDIVLEDIDVSSAAVRGFMRKNIPSIDSGAQEIDAAKAMLENGVRALPVCKSGKLIGIISETELIGFVKGPVTAGSIISEPVCIMEDDGIGKARQMMREHGVSRLPVVNSGNNLVGTIDTIDLIRIMNPKEKPAKSFETPTRVSVKSLMREPATISSSSGLAEIVKAIKEGEEAIVTDGKKLLGIITPKDILELLIPKHQESRIQVSHLDRDDLISKSIIHDALDKWVNKSGMKLDYIFVYVHMHHTNGRIKYSLNMRLRNSMGLFVAKSVDWDLLTAVQDLIKKSEKIMEKRHGKIVDRRRQRL